MTLLDVYKPSDDSLLLLNSLPPHRRSALEVGTASGFIIKNYKGVEGGLYIGCDLICAGADIVCDGDELPFRSNAFDLIFFNPPYLPSIRGAPVDIAVDGGTGGVEVASKFLLDAVRCLKRGGEIYVLLSSLSNISKFRQIAEEIGLKTCIVNKKELFMESLFVIKLYRG